MDFNLEHLRAFIVVARSNNISAAAKKLGVSQPNLSRQMVALENELHLSLFVRHSRGIGLTKQGADFLELSEHIVGQLVQGTDEIRQKDSDPEGILKIVTGTAALERILGHLPTFSKQYPKICFNFSSAVDVFQFQIGDADIGIFPCSFSDPNLIQHPLHEMSIRIYASPKYLKEYGRPNNPDDLKYRKLIIFKDEPHEILSYQARKNNHPPSNSNFTPFIEVNSGIALQSALIKGYGIGAIGYDQNLVKAGLLIDIFPELPDQSVPYFFTYHQRLEGSPKIKAFHKFIKEVVKAWELPERN